MIYSTGGKNKKNYSLMRGIFIRLSFIVICLSCYISAVSQKSSERTESGKVLIDSLRRSGIIFNDKTRKPEIILSRDQAVRFLLQRIQPQYWNDPQDPFRQSMDQLVYEASHPGFDSAEYFLKSYPYDSLNIPWNKFYIWKSLHLKIPVISAHELYIQGDSSATININPGAVGDSLFLKSQIHQNKLVIKDAIGLKDTTIMVVVDTLNEVTSSVKGFPFRHFSFPYQSDSIRIAIEVLLNYLDNRDSTIINFTGIDNSVTSVLMNSNSDKMVRFWLKNEFSDSVTIWIENPARNTIGLYLEKGVNIRRPVRQGNYSEAKINVPSLDNSRLLEVQEILVKHQFWKYRTESNFVLSQSALSNWVKGGENSIATAMDVTAYSDYNNKPMKLSSNNFIRLKLGFLKSGTDPLRKNLDLLETNSKLNHKAFGKFDFSAIMLFKTQIARGYNYTKINDRDTATLVSKFMSPGILTIGLGLDYKPDKNTSINFSPLSYKGTFVRDTVRIDQTKYGIAKDKRSLNEPGASFMISNIFKPFKNVSVTNRLQLFTNYIHNPQNIDVDWEMIAVANLNWFTDVRFNTHLIFDDDTRTVELGKDKMPVLRPDGTEKKTARIQFKEMLGFSLVFRF